MKILTKCDENNKFTKNEKKLPLVEKYCFCEIVKNNKFHFGD